MSNDNISLKERILLEAVCEFGNNGYRAASSNNIIKNAGVSKGLLFHYYKNKKNLYKESVLYAVSIFMDYTAETRKNYNSDIFERMREVMKIKLSFFRQYPEFLTLIDDAWYVSGKEAGVESILKEIYLGSLAEFKEGVDVGQLADDIDVSKLISYVSLSLEASWRRFTDKYRNRHISDHFDEYIAEADDILRIMKFGAFCSER